jgi:HK97 family phage portal protein
MWFSNAFSGAGASTQESGTWLGSTAGSWGVQSDAGEVVSPTSAFAIPAVQRCVMILAEAVSRLPVKIYQELDDGGFSEIKDHALRPLLQVAPAPFLTVQGFSEFKQISLGLRGNAYAVKLYDNRGRLISLMPINPDRVIVMINPQDHLPYYRITMSPVDGIEGVFAWYDIHHVRWGNSENPFVGLSPVMLHADPLGISMATERHAGKTFKNGTNLGGFLTRPATQKGLTNEAVKAVLNAWNEAYSGARNAGKTALLQEGMEFKQISMTNADAQIIESRKFGVTEIARIYGVPLHMLGEMAGSTKSNIEQESLNFLNNTLMPWLRRHEEAMERDFLTLDERLSGITIRYDTKDLLRGDTAARYASYATGIQWGFISPNDARHAENLPPIPGGDRYLEPLNMMAKNDILDQKANNGKN